MRGEMGLILRLGGFLIEAACAITLIGVRGKGRTIAGLPIESPLYLGLGLGFLVWTGGMIATRLAMRRARED